MSESENNIINAETVMYQSLSEMIMTTIQNLVEQSQKLVVIYFYTTYHYHDSETTWFSNLIFPKQLAFEGIVKGLPFSGIHYAKMSGAAIHVSCFKPGSFTHLTYCRETNSILIKMNKASPTQFEIPACAIFAVKVGDDEITHLPGYNPSDFINLESPENIICPHRAFTGDPLDQMDRMSMPYCRLNKSPFFFNTNKLTEQ